MSMEQGWEMHFLVIWEPQNPKFSLQLQTWWYLWETLYQANNLAELKSESPWLFWNLEALKYKNFDHCAGLPGAPILIIFIFCYIFC